MSLRSTHQAALFFSPSPVSPNIPVCVRRVYRLFTGDCLTKVRSPYCCWMLAELPRSARLARLLAAPHALHCAGASAYPLRRSKSCPCLYSPCKNTDL